jgi:hypothetical protein
MAVFGGKKKGKPERAYIEVAWLDNVLTALFVVLCTCTIFTLLGDLEGLLGLGLMLFIVALKINAIRFLSKHLGRLIDFNGMLLKRINMKKFEDQMWQLAIHVSMSAAEALYVFEPEWFPNVSNTVSHGNLRQNSVLKCFT